MSITLSDHVVCLQHIRRDAVHHSGFSATADPCLLIITIIIIRSFLYHHKVLTSEVVAEQVRSHQSLSIIVSQVHNKAMLVLQLGFDPGISECSQACYC